MRKEGKYEYSEDIAQKYLYGLGYTLDDFLFTTHNPDFVTKDGKRWEVKRISRNGKTSFTWNQVRDYSGETDVIGIFENNVIFVKNYLELKSYIKNLILDTTEMFSLLVDYEQKQYLKKRFEENRILIEKLNRIDLNELKLL